MAASLNDEGRAEDGTSGARGRRSKCTGQMTDQLIRAFGCGQKMNPNWGTISGPFAAAAHATMACNNEIPPLLPIPPMGKMEFCVPHIPCREAVKPNPKVGYY